MGAPAGGRTLVRQYTPAVAGLRTPGRRRSYLALGTPLPMPCSASPGYGRSAHAGVGGRTLDRQDAPVVPGLRTPGREGGGRSWLVCTPRREGGHLTGRTP